MGASVSSAGAGGRSRQTTHQTPTTLAEINVTPLVDVMLVLLIVFMISAPLMQQGAQVDLPKANSGSLSEAPTQIKVTLTKSRQILIGDAQIQPGTLRDKLAGMAQANPDVQVYINADQSIPYGFVAQVMAEVKQARINRVGLVTQPGDPDKRL